MPGSEQTYAYLRELVLKECGNVITMERTAQFDRRLEPIARLMGAADLDALVHRLRTQTMPAGAYRAICEGMLIQETSFFRDWQPFELMREFVLPKLIERAAAARTLRLWSAASSTGQEAYSLAMMVLEHFPELRAWDVKIIGTDVSERARVYAERGRYNRVEINRGLPARLMLKYFSRDGEEWEAKPCLKRMVEFRCANLCQPLHSLPVFDLVLLRNVLLYFSREDRAHVLRSVRVQMHADSVLLLGNSEQAEESTRLFAATLNTSHCYYRPAA